MGFRSHYDPLDQRPGCCTGLSPPLAPVVHGHWALGHAEWYFPLQKTGGVVRQTDRGQAPLLVNCYSPGVLWQTGAPGRGLALLCVATHIIKSALRRRLPTPDLCPISGKDIQVLFSARSLTAPGERVTGGGRKGGRLQLSDGGHINKSCQRLESHT